MRPLACNWYYCAQFVAKPEAAYALRFSWAATSSNLGLWANITSSTNRKFITYHYAARRGPTVAAIQVVQVVRCTRAHDPWGPTSEYQIAIFLKN